MTGAVADSLRELLAFEKDRYLKARKTDGGTAEGFRRHISKEHDRDKLKFSALMFQALMEATTKCWERQPRRSGPDLFSIDGIIVPETLTRHRKPLDLEGDDIDDELQFEKVHQAFATVNDLYEDATIKLRKAAQASAAAEKEMERADKARRRAGGDLSKFIRDIAD